MNSAAAALSLRQQADTLFQHCLLVIKDKGTFPKKGGSLKGKGTEWSGSKLGSLAVWEEGETEFLSR